jgi:formylglycine-generating enzyme required for sulfatase activity
MAALAAVVALGCTPLNSTRDAGVDMSSQDRPADRPTDGPTDRGALDMKRSDARQDTSGAVDSAGTGCGRFSRGAAMVEVPMLGHTICVDTTEVTQAQYKQFLVAMNGKTDGQGPECSSWNTLYAPSSICSFDPVGHASFPVNGVDWCDATAFCKWAGKRLCGGATSGSLIESDSLIDLDRADVSEWTAACSHGGDQAYPYGTVFDGDACNDGEHMTTPVIVPVETMPLCQGGYPGLYDLMGNVHEWENACAPLDSAPPTQSDNCWIRGGSYHDTNTTCFSGWPVARNYVDTDCDIGIRCCADP